MNNKKMNEVIKSLKEYMGMKKEIDATIDELKAQAIEFMTEAEIDEYLNSENGDKVTYRPVVSKRIDTTKMKKDMPQVYEAYLKKTESMRFTVN